MRISTTAVWLGLLVTSRAWAQMDAPVAGWLNGHIDIVLNMAAPVVPAVVGLWAWHGFARRRQVAAGVSVPPASNVPLVWAIAVLLAGLTVAVMRVQASRQEVYADARLRFGLQVDRIEESIHDAFDSLLPPLRSVRGALVSSDFHSRSAFRKFMLSRDIDHEFPGARGFGVIDRVMRPALPAFIAQQRKDGAPDFVVKTTGEAPDLFVIKYIEPLERNRAAVGLDVGAEPIRRLAAERALREGKAALSGRITLVQDGEKRPGFLYYLPYYASVRVPDTEHERLRLFKGWAYAPIVLAELMAGTLESTQDMAQFQLFFGSETDGSALVFDSTEPMGRLGVAAGVDHALGHMFHTSRPILVGGQLLTLRANTTDRFEQSVDLKAPGRSAFWGALLSILVSALVWLILTARVRAMAMAKDMTAELSRMALVAQRTSNAVVFTNAAGRVVWVNEGFTRISGYTAEEAMGKVPGHLLQNANTDKSVVQTIGRDLRARRGGTYELINQRKDGSEYWISMEIQPLPDEHGEIKGFMSVESDITVARHAQESLKLEKERADNILSGTNVGTWQSNLQTGASSCSDRWCAMMGFNLEEVVPSVDEFWRQQVHPDDKVRIGNALERCRQGLADEYSIEVRAIHKSGRWLWILSRAKVMSRTPDGDVEWIGGIHTDITDTKALEIGLRDMESFLNRAGRLAGVGAWEVDLKTHRVKWSEQTCLIHGVEPGFQPSMEEALGFYLESDRETVRAAIRRAIEQAVGWDLTASIVNAHGQALWVRSTGETEFDDTGAVRLVGAFQDVTREKEIQLKIERSEAILRESIDAVNEAYVLYDPQDRLVFCNEKYRVLYAASADLIVPGATFESIIRGGAERGQYRAAVGRVDEWVTERMRQHLAGATNMEQLLDNGRWLRVVERLMPDGHRVGFRVDITELKQANEAAQAANRSLAQTSATLQAVLDSAVNVGVIATDLGRKVTVFNKGAENLTGHAAADMLHRRSLGLLFDPSQMDLVRESLALQLGHEPDEDEVFSHVAESRDTPEWTLVRKDGTTFIATMVISPMREPNGDINGYLAITYDVTHQKEYEDSLRVAMRKAEESNVSKSQFLANMSHEIRTPMNAILGMLQLLHSTPLSPRQLDYADKTESAARSLLGLLNDILDFSKVEAGKMQLDLEPFSLSQLLDDLSVILSSNLGGKDVDLLFDVDPDVPARLVGDALRLKQVLINLGGNAVKFTERGHVVLRMRVLEKEADRVRLEISVVDTGIGIAPENQGRIFDAFTQAEASTTRRFGGTGLGLVISRRLIRLMGGELDLVSAPGQGSTFRFVLELQVVPTMEDAQLPAPVAAATGALRTLLVDDNPVALASSAAIMRSLGWDVIQANSGEQAVAALRSSLAQGEGALDAVFVDWRMPGMDGWETLRTIRRLYAEQGAPVLVLMSGQGHAALHQRTEREQALIGGYMVKPLTADMFRSVMAHALEAPQVASTAPPALAATATDAKPVTGSLGGMRILVVEDNPINQQVAKELLCTQGASVTLADNGQLGVDAALAAHPPFDIVLMDLQMPVMDGLTAARSIRQTAALQHMPIIAMTANVMATDREACLQAGMNDHIGKPFDLKALVQVLVRHTDWTPQALFAMADADTNAPAAEHQSADLHRKPWPPGVDVEGALERMGGNTGLLHRAMSAFVQQTLTFRVRLLALLESDALADVRRELHTLKGLSASLGVDDIAGMAAHAEKLAVSTQDGVMLRAACDAVCLGLDRALPALQEVVARTDTSGDRGKVAGSAAPLVLQGKEKLQMLTELQRLKAALEMFDMSAMEIHATLRQTMGDAIEDGTQALDAAMADLDFELAAIECSKLIDIWS
ncbi:MAG: PAS domain S-box protein [Burkholderiales bacterium]|nr:PAS domain S-box protein [Burkholderiales bacterium]